MLESFSDTKKLCLIANARFIVCKKLGVFVLFFGVMSCGKSDKKPISDPVKSELGSEVEEEIILDKEKAQVEKLREKLKVDTISPSISTVGPYETLPQYISIGFSNELIKKAPRQASKKTKFKISPDHAGSLRFSSKSVLDFVPSTPFRPSTTYTAKLSAIESRDGVITPKTPWTKTFTTPKFSVLELTGSTFQDRAELEIKFSAPVKTDLKAYATWKINGHIMQGVRYEKGTTPNRVRAIFDSQFLDDSKVVELELDEVPYAFDSNVKTKKQILTKEIASGPRVVIHQIFKKEGNQGYYLQVVCDDGSVDGNRDIYLQGTYYDVSKRCVPDENSIQDQIRIHPKIDNMRIVKGKGGFNIFGDFKRGNYEVEIGAGITTLDGGVVFKSMNRFIAIPKRNASIRFTSQGRYLPLKLWQHIPIKTLNVSELHIKARHIPKSNIAFWLSGTDDRVDDRTSTVVAEKKIKLDFQEDKTKVHHLDISQFIEKPEPGVYQIEANAFVNSQVVSDRNRVVVTNMNLIAKTSEVKPGKSWPEEIAVWALDIETNKPKVGVEIKLLRRNGNVFAKCKTTSRGSCTLRPPLKDMDPTPPFAIIAEYKNEFSFLKYADLKIPVTSVGKPYYSQTKYKSAIYGDRDVYRPGEIAHFVSVIREVKTQKAPKANLPVEMRIYDPRSKRIRSRVLKTNAAGMVSLDYHFADFAPTGAYRVDVYIGKRKLHTYRFNVEEFVPERMKVSANFQRKSYLNSETARLLVDAKYLFGGSAEGNPVETRCRLKATRFSPPKYKDFLFGTQTHGKSTYDLGTTNDIIGEKGSVYISCPNEYPESRTGVAELLTTVAVFEAGSGRTSNASAKTLMHMTPYHIGLKTQTKEAKAGVPIEVSGILVDWKGEVKLGVDEVEVELIRLEYNHYWYWNENEDGDNWGEHLKSNIESVQKVKVENGRFKLSLTPLDYASKYVVRVKNDKTESSLELQAEGWNRYYWDSSEKVDLTPRPQRATEILIEGADRVPAGEPAEFIFDIPFSGRMLITIETAKVLHSEWVDVKGGKYRWKYTPKAFISNFYVGALLVKDPYLDSKTLFTPDRAIGFKSIEIDSDSRTHDIQIQAPKEIRPNSKLDIKIDVGRANANTYISIAAVDEGILSLTKYKTPNLLEQLFAPHKLGVNTYETIGWTIARSPAGPSGRTGGGGDEEEEEAENEGGLGRVKVIKPVSLWSGLVKVDTNGKADISLDVPSYQGSLRIMVISADDERTGHAETQVLVRDPIVLQATLPRFLSASDEIMIPVAVTNMTGSKKTIEIKMLVENSGLPGIVYKEEDASIIKFLSPQTVKVSTKNGESKTVLFKVKALQESGTAKFKVSASTEGIHSFAENEVPFRPTGSQERIVKVIELSKGETNLSEALKGWVRTSETTTLWVSTNPYGKVFDHLKYLIRYPYGCIEQTTSSTRPLLFVGEFVKNADPATIAKLGSLEAMVNSGIRRVFSMQTSSGGFSYWPGGNSPDRWGTAYATHMLLDAKSNGYEVSELRLKEVFEYIENVTENYRVHGRFYELSQQAYLHYVLGLAGKANPSRIRRLIKAYPKDISTGSQKETLYLLKAALYLAGDRHFKKDLLNVDTSTLDDERDSRWAYYSDRRRRAFMLSIFFDLFGKNAKGKKLANRVAQSLSSKPSYYYTTQEMMWGVTGLGKWIQGGAKNIGKVTLSLEGKARTPNTVSKRTKEPTWLIPRASEYGEIKVNLPEKEGKVFAILSSTGIRKDAKPRAEIGGLTITRDYFDLEGKKLGQDGHELGDIIFVRITISNSLNRNLDNLALVDRFSGAFEVENSAFGRGDLPSWIDKSSLWSYQHINIRDDRIEVFGSLRYNETKNFVYTVRAVSSGTFMTPAPEIEAMYEPEVWATEKPSIIKVHGSW